MPTAPWKEGEECSQLGQLGNSSGLQVFNCRSPSGEMEMASTHRGQNRYASTLFSMLKPVLSFLNQDHSIPRSHRNWDAVQGLPPPFHQHHPSTGFLFATVCPPRAPRRTVCDKHPRSFAPTSVLHPMWQRRTSRPSREKTPLEKQHIRKRSPQSSESHVKSKPHDS